MAAVRPLWTGQELRAQVSQGEALRRVAGPLLILLQPLLILAAAAAGVTLLRQRRIPAKLYLPAAVAVFVAALFAGALRLYVRPWAELWATAQATAAGGGSPSAVQGALGELATDRIGVWLVTQLPFAIAAGLLLGSSWAALRSRRLAPWRRPAPALEPVPTDRVAKALAALPLWPDQSPTRRRGLHRRVQVKSPETDGGADADDDASEADEDAPEATDVREAATPRVGSRLPPIGGRRLCLGVHTLGRPDPFYLTVGELGHHGYVDGPAGAGKTTVLLEICAGLIESPHLQAHRNPLVFITMKPDPDTTRALAGMAAAAGRRFWHVTQDGTDHSDRYAPLQYGTANEIASAVVEAEANSAAGGFTEPHHRRAAERFVRLAARAMVELAQRDPKRHHRTYAALKTLMYPANMGKVADLFSPALAEDWKAYQAEITQDTDLRRSIAGLRQRVADAAEGGAKPVLEAGTSAALVIQDAIAAGDVVVFDLDADADPNAAQLIGNLALRDITASLARLSQMQWHRLRDQNGRIVNVNGEPVQVRHCQVIVDEFSALGGTQLAGLYRRARSRGAGVVLATQEGGALDEAGPGFAEMVVTNSRVIILFAQGPNAERHADLFGTEKWLEESQQVFEEASLVAENVYASGQGNLREVRRYVLSPDDLRGLGQGQAYIRVRYRDDSRPARIAIRRTAEARHRDHDWPGGQTSSGDDSTNPYLVLANGQPPTTPACAPRPARRTVPRAMHVGRDATATADRDPVDPDTEDTDREAVGADPLVADPQAPLWGDDDVLPDTELPGSDRSNEGQLWNDDDAEPEDWSVLSNRR